MTLPCLVTYHFQVEPPFCPNSQPMEFVPPDDIIQPSCSSPLFLTHQVMGSATLDDGMQASHQERYLVLIEEVDDPLGMCFRFSSLFPLS